jgi:GntR family transcriptional regulator
LSTALDRNSSEPLYSQLQRILEANIASGEWAPGQRIPSENELNRQFGLSRMTVRGVLNKLAADDLVIRVPGKGTYVATQKINAVSPAYKGIREQLEALGYSTSTELLSTELATPREDVRLHLQLNGGDQVFSIVRRRLVDARPISIHRSYIPSSLAPGLDQHDVINKQLCVVLEENYGLPMRNVQEHLEAEAASTADAKLLDLRRGDPLLRLTDVIFDSTGVPFEYSEIVFRGDRLRLRFDYAL